LVKELEVGVTKQEVFVDRLVPRKIIFFTSPTMLCLKWINSL